MVSDETMVQEMYATNEALIKLRVNKNDFVVISKSRQYNCVMVWLHGEGDSTASFA